jgi:hypothetical protein
MERTLKLTKSAELPFFGAVFITIAAGSVLWSSILYGLYLIISKM